MGFEHLIGCLRRPQHHYVHEVQGMGFKVKKIVLRGWPACIYCSAQNESKSVFMARNTKQIFGNFTQHDP